MLLMPPRTARNLSPVYNIGVSLNLRPFTPLSYVTTVRRGGTADGPVVGEFEWVSILAVFGVYGDHPLTQYLP